ncbi:LacI family DNA-binding transcriptional regulator [Vreelandella populi]|uniref:LacI family DNA-binding transcriptional regulator n=1 Tax=Vreelandella populi TaxID=2498858 RepID=UPI000F8F4E90|nr:LacI family DNA-binding transcriptional regulator [Halomonas populi]RUR36643.1 LacI family transcriptional regulator [Halomonas populi]
MARKITIRDVSKHAGVGLGTVSRFVSGRGYVKQETGEKIRAAIEELGFTPSFHATAMRGTVGTSVSVIVPDISNALSSFVVKTLGDELRQHDIKMFFASPSGRPEVEAEIVQNFISRAVDGMFLMPSDEDNVATTNLLQLQNFPKIILERDFMHGVPGVSHVLTDHASGVVEAVAYLKSTNHTSAALFCPQTGRPGRDRGRAFTDAMNCHNMQATVLMGSMEGDWVHDEIVCMSCANALPEALIVGHNRYLAPLITALRKCGHVIGQDVSLITHDRVDLGELHFPPIATIERDVALIGKLACRCYLDMRDNGEEGRREVIPTTFRPTLSIVKR